MKTAKQKAIQEQYNKLNVARCSTSQLRQKSVQQWVEENSIEVVDCTRRAGAYPKGYGNPFSMKYNRFNPAPTKQAQEEEVNKVCDQFKNLVDANLNMSSISLLKGKLLVCYCDSGSRCHVDTYINILSTYKKVAV